MKKVKLLLDTDIGDDIDDAFALAFSLRHPNIDLIGVTTVYRNTKARAKQTKKYLDTVNCMDIPVHAGEGIPIKEPIHYFEKDQPNDLGFVIPCQFDQTYETYEISDLHAVDFMINCAKQYQDELIIATIGPLTNLAKAIKKDPDAMSSVKRIVMMGGEFINQIPEWNILCDPEAADIVFKSGLEIKAVGLNVTLQCTLDDDLLDLVHSVEQPHLQLLSLWLKRWFNHFNFKKSVMHDPLAIATIVDDEICIFEKKDILVDLTEKRGAIRIVERNSGYPIEIATSVNRQKFYDIFKQYVLR